MLPASVKRDKRRKQGAMADQNFSLIVADELNLLRYNAAIIEAQEVSRP
jgi:hypothetical protein